jgi:hypothetical protein
MSALPPKADMYGAARDIRFGPIADVVKRFPERRSWELAGKRPPDKRRVAHS